MTLIEFLCSLPEGQAIVLIVILLLCGFGCIAPYFSLLHLGGIEKNLNRIVEELKKNKIK